MVSPTAASAPVEEPQSLTLAGQDLRGRDFGGANLSKADLVGCDLRGVSFAQANLDGANLLGANLTGADLREVSAVGANFGGATLDEAMLTSATLESAMFTKASLCGADLRLAELRGARFTQADLSRACLDSAKAREISLFETTVTEASFRSTDLRSARIAHLRGFDTADWIDAHLTDVDFRGAYDVRRFAMDENYLFEFRTRNRTNAGLYWVWKLTSDCGRNFSRWLFFVGGIAVAFAGIYALVDIDYGNHETVLSPLYFSVVTSTTLGYGDALPVSAAAQVVVMVQVFMGYIFLGGLVSILAEKLARRA